MVDAAMTNPVGKADYRVRRTPDKPAPAAADAGTAAIVDFLQLLGRAARQFHTYPATSPMCTDAIDACHRAFMGLDVDGPFTFRVAPRTIIVGDEVVGGDSIIEQEVARPLHRVRVASVEIERGVSIRDWSRFCTTLAAAARASRLTSSFAELLLDAGVAAILPRETPRPEVLDIGAPAPAVRTLVDRERVRQAAAVSGGPAQHLYPPDKGWVRVDPGAAIDESISLTDLTVIVNEPAELAAMLARLIDGDAADAAGDAALQQRYDDVVMLISAVDPRLARVLFSKLARAVLRLDADTRRTLLRSAVLPSLLDGRLAGEAVLGEFPDVDLADALCLLLDLEAAAPQLLSLALDRLRLPSERRTSLTPLIEAKLDARAARDGDADRTPTSFDDQARALTRLDYGIAANLSEFTAFDLSINDQTAATLATLRDAATTVDGPDAQLACAVGLVRIEPNPAVAAAVLARALPSLRVLVRDRRWPEVTRWVARIAEAEEHVEPLRPDVAAAVRDTVAALCDRTLVQDLAQLCGSEPTQRYASAIVAALGPSLVPAWLAALDDATDRARARSLAGAMCQCARRVAPAIARRLPSLGADASRSAVAVLGFAGAGYEQCIVERVSVDDERTSREALRALARSATAKAAALIVGQLEQGHALVHPAAEEALWRLPASIALAKTRELLGRREFVTRNPQSAARLLERAAQTGDDGFDPVLESLTSLRFHFWSPAIARVGAKARELLQ